MSLAARRFVRAVRTNRATTSVHADDPRLRGRTYAVPFEDVWQASLRICAKYRRWKVMDSDDYEGVIRVCAKTLLGEVDEITIAIGLDVDAQTRVDLTSRAEKGFADFGRNTRRIGKFSRALDRELNRKFGRSVEVDPAAPPLHALES